jgi:hypothetical protein
MIISACAVNSTAVTPSDSTVVHCEAIYVGVTGNVAIKHHTSDTAVTYVAVPAGSILPVKIVGGHIMATNTTATSIVKMSV